MKITVNYDPEFDEGSLNDEIKDAITKKMVEQYMGNIEKSFTEKLENQILSQVMQIAKKINTIELDKCNTTGIKEVVTIEQFITTKAIEALTTKVDRYGKSGYNGSSDKRTITEWYVKEIISDSNNKFMKELKNQITIIERKYRESLEEMVNKTLAPLYKELRKQIKA